MPNSHNFDAPPTTSGVEYSRYVRRVRARYGPLSDKLEPGLLNKEILNRSFNALSQSFTNPDDALRVLRQLALVRIATLDCDAGADLSQITQMMTVLAEWALSKAYELAFNDLSLKFGQPTNALGQPATFWIIGMGKLGATELNVSSDIDLIYIYDHEGEAKFAPADEDPNAGLGVQPHLGSRPNISNQEFYTKLVHQIQRLLDSVTEHGRVFRIDLALRPNGMSGPSVMCLDALEEYLQSQGREWERFAWLKSRVVAPVALTSLPLELSQIVYPFVYRKYLDYQVFDSLRHLHQQIRAQAVRFAAGRPERINDIKLGRGGIREIEFITQLLQIVRGGQFPELRVRPTLLALSLLAQTRHMSTESATHLQNAYIFLRRLEHRIQYLDDQQTHLLPTASEDIAWIAASLGFSSANDLLQALEFHKNAVSAEFTSLLGTPPVDPKPLKSSGANYLTASTLPGKAPSLLENFELTDLTISNQSPLRERFLVLLNHPKAQLLKESSQSKLLTLIEQTARWVASDSSKELGALRWCDWMELLLRRENYLSLLIERPAIHSNLIYLLGASRWAAQYLNQHPGVIDDLADSQLLLQRFNHDLFVRSLLQRIEALEASDDVDEEAILNLMRRAHHSEFFLCLARDLSGKLKLEEVADDLSALADAVIFVTAQVVWRRLKNPHTPFPSFAIVGYGKLGGKELGYGSDLDIVFIFDDSHQSAAQTYALFARKIIHWLSVKTISGDLYEIDTALRPNGNSGLLVTQLEAFENYQLQRGANVAWLWEHQAMTRARVVLGDDHFKDKFSHIRTQVLTMQRDLPSLAAEIVGMRNKLLQAHIVKENQFDLKYSPGAMIDVEFAVQYLILAYSFKFKELTANIGNIGLLAKAQSLNLISTELANSCLDAYKNYRQAQHIARLDERSLKFDKAAFATEQSNVLKLWKFLFPD
jgi:glutamate-ammonia-ligase adenylyltransferase